MSLKTAEPAAEIAEKMKRLMSLIEERGLGGILLNRVNNFAWITGGVGDNQIVWGSEIGFASILVLKDGRKLVIGSHSEVSRLMCEGLADLGYEAVELKWFESAGAFFESLKGSGPLASDVERPGFVTVDIAPLRAQLTETEIVKYRKIGQFAADAVVEVARQIRPGMWERDVEALAASALMVQGLRPTVVLVGSDDRLVRFRRALPSETKRVEKHAMVSVCAKKWGLTVSVGRLVHFGPLDTELRSRYEAVATINARFMASLKPGTRIADLMEQAKRWYAELGYPGEWEFHHQGGRCGYSERECLLDANSEEVVIEHQAYALNPTVQGAKAEDTFIVFREHLENITETRDWPTTPVNVDGKVYNSPDVLIVGAPQTVWNLNIRAAAR